VPASGIPLFQNVLANLNPFTEAKVDVDNPDRGPLLIIAGERDNTIRPAISQSAYAHQRKKPGRHRDHPDSRTRALPDHRRRRPDVARTALEFIRHHV
jgi:non-heme chloroperoxidase